MQLVIEPGGAVRCIYGEDLNLASLGRLDVRRASHVEPTEDGQWTADLSPVSGPQLGPFTKRSEALSAEAAWLAANWLDLGGDRNGERLQTSAPHIFTTAAG